MSPAANIAVAGVPGAWSTERLAAALRSAGAVVQMLDLSLCSLRLPDRRLYCGGQPVTGLDGIVVKKIGDTADGWVVQERINLLRHLEGAGVTVLSEPARLEAAVDRYRMTVELVRAGLPVPETVVTEDTDEAAEAVGSFEQAVLKPLYPSKGRGMRRLVPGRELRPALESHRMDGRGPFYVQRLIEHPGRDLGVAVLDGRYLGAYWRIAGQEQWMTTIRSGGRYAPADPPIGAIDIAVRAANHFGLVFTAVDLMELPGGGFVVLALGYPKQPRVNPGTLLHHPRLSALLGHAERTALASLGRTELWELERKSDVDLDAIYGRGTVELGAVLRALVLLKWRLDGEGFEVRRLTPTHAMANLPLFQKDLGVFDLARPLRRPAPVDELRRYAAILDRVQVLEVTGGIDFSALVDLVGDLLSK